MKDKMLKIVIEKTNEIFPKEELITLMLKKQRYARGHLPDKGPNAALLRKGKNCIQKEIIPIKK